MLAGALREKRKKVRRINGDCSPTVMGEQQVVSVDAPAPAVQTPTPAAPISMSQAAMPIAVQGCPQVLTGNSHDQYTFTYLSKTCLRRTTVVCYRLRLLSVCTEDLKNMCKAHL